MANDRKPQEDELVAKLVPDPSQGPPDATVLRGYLGRAPEPAGKAKDVSWRLYQSPALDEYVEIPEAEILHTQKLPDEEGTLVWVPKSLALHYVRVHSEQVQAELLGGSIAGSRLSGGTANIAGGGPLPPSLGIACSVVNCPSQACVSRTPCPSVACASQACISHTPCPSAPCPSYTTTCTTQAGACVSGAPSHCTLCPTPSATPSHCTHCPPPISAISACGAVCPVSAGTYCPSRVGLCTMIVSHCGICPPPKFEEAPVSFTCHPVSAACHPTSFGCPPPTVGCPGRTGGETEE